jgi:hypothetical protein
MTFVIKVQRAFSTAQLRHVASQTSGSSSNSMSSITLKCFIDSRRVACIYVNNPRELGVDERLVLTESDVGACEVLKNLIDIRGEAVLPDTEKRHFDSWMEGPGVDRNISDAVAALKVCRARCKYATITAVN